MKKLSVILVVVLVITGCSMYHLQTPDTVPPGRTAFGIGITGTTVGEENVPLAFPGFWARTGLTPNMDVGVHSWGLGLLGDIKFKIIRYLAVGGGAGVSFFGASFLYLQASIYGGIPLGPVEPYMVLRGHFGGISYGGESTSGNFTSGVIGLRLNFANRFSLMGEVGKLASKDSSSPMFGLGVSIGH